MKVCKLKGGRDLAVWSGEVSGDGNWKSASQMAGGSYWWVKEVWQLNGGREWSAVDEVSGNRSAVDRTRECTVMV